VNVVAREVAHGHLANVKASWAFTKHTAISNISGFASTTSTPDKIEQHRQHADLREDPYVKTTNCCHSDLLLTRDFSYGQDHHP